MKDQLFRLHENGTDVRTEITAGLTTFFSMAYLITVIPNMLAQTGMPWGAAFLATIVAAVVGTLFMGLVANVPYVQAPGIGLTGFFVFTVVLGFGFRWQEALAMVLICGLVNILITATQIRKLLIKSIPESLKNAIGGGIGVFISYIGIKNAGLLNFTADPGTYTILEEGGTVIADASIVPGLVPFNTAPVLLALVGIILTIVLLIKEVRGAIFISIIATTILGIPLGVTKIGSSVSLAEAFSQLPITFFAAFDGLQSLFSNLGELPLVLMTIFAFSLTDIYDTIGTFIGTGRQSGIFSSDEDLESNDGLKTKLDKALFADAVATAVGAVIGTSNVTTYVESAAGIGAGARTGLTSVVVAILLLASALFAPFVSGIPAAATAPTLIVVGIMMLSSFKDIAWDELDTAIPAFFTTLFMGFSYSISYGIAAGFIFYCIVKVLKRQAHEINPVLWASTALFILNFIILAVV